MSVSQPMGFFSLETGSGEIKEGNTFSMEDVLHTNVLFNLINLIKMYMIFQRRNFEQELNITHTDYTLIAYFTIGEKAECDYIPVLVEI